jgi:AraC-like DNA-binding protein
LPVRGRELRMHQRSQLETRASEAREIIDVLLARGWSMNGIAQSARVSSKTIYRWHREGTAPHPAMLDNLRRLGSQNGTPNHGR